MGEDRTAIYEQAVLESVPRLLGLIDARPSSPTLGCLDRDFWHAKALRGHPGATFQQPMWGLAKLATADFPGNPYFGNREMLRLARAALRFWTTIQQRDGSFAEWFESERSPCATAYGCLAAAETLGILGDGLEAEIRRRALQAVSRGIDWLSRFRDPVPGNQALAAARAAFEARALLEDHSPVERFAGASLALQDEEGWFDEDGGADLGYSLISLEHLERLRLLDAPDRWEKASERLVGFLQAVWPEDGSLEGEFGSRAGTYALPGGLEEAAVRNPSAASLGDLIAEGYRAQGARLPKEVDDRYFAFFYFNSFVRALVSAKTRGVNELRRSRAVSGEAREEGVAHLARAGLLRIRKPRYHAVFGIKRGGNLRVSSARSFVWADWGYVLPLRGGRNLATGGFSENATANIYETGREAEVGEIRIELRAPLSERRDRVPLLRWDPLFRLATRSVFQIPAVSHWFRRRLRQRPRATDRIEGGPELERTVRFGADRIVIEDTLLSGHERPFGAPLGVIERAGPEGTAHSPGGNTGSAARVAVAADTEEGGLCLDRQGRFRSRTEIDFTGGGPVIRVTTGSQIGGHRSEPEG